MECWNKPELVVLMLTRRASGEMCADWDGDE